MKTTCLVVILTLFLRCSFAATGVAPIDSPSGTGPTLSNSYNVIQRDAHTRTWASVRTQTNVLGRTRSRTNTYIEVETGMHRKDSKGQWVEANDTISPTFGGASATNTAHQVFFAANANSAQALQVITPDARTLSSHVLCLSYYDTVTGSNALIAELHDSIGQIIGPNQVLYTNALSGDCAADILYRNSKAGIEQNIILRSQPPSPAEFGISNPMLQVWTEFVSSPPPLSLSTVNGELADEQLDFGAMKMGPGQAFLIGDSTYPPARVFKQWVHLDGRTFLVEQVPLDSVTAQLNQLPQASGGGIGPHGSVRPHPPKYRFAKAGANAMQLAQGDTGQRPGFLLDYNMTSATNFTFQADTTYYLSGAVLLSGSNVFEGGCVLKYATNALLNVYPTTSTPTITFFSSPYRPVIFTAKDDQSVGSTIAGSSNSPSGYYANPALYLAGLSLQVPSLHHIRIAYAKQGISLQGNPADITDAQFVNCSNAMEVTYGTTHLRNTLLANCITNIAFTSGGTSLSAENVTFCQCNTLAAALSSPSSIELDLTNCILADVTNLSVGVLSVNAVTNGFWNSPTVGSVVTNKTYPFQTAGGGNYYLANGCAFLGAGTTNINTNLLATLPLKTTQPPVILAGSVLTTNDLTLSTQALRESTIPDLGYAYDPIDFEFGAVTVTNAATITATAGIVIAGYGTNGNGKSLTLYNGAQLLTQGSPTQPVRVVEYGTVQEQTPTNWSMPFYSVVTDDINEDGNPPAAAYINCRFTDFSLIADNTASLGFMKSACDVRDCQFHGGVFVDYAQSSATNCSFDRVESYVEPYFNYGTAAIENCLYFGGTIFCDSATGTNLIANTLFDRTQVNYNDVINRGGFNAFVTNYSRIHPTNANDIIIGDTDYAAGPLGRFYYPTNGGNLTRLINAGSANADVFGLYHFTTITNLIAGKEIKETNSVVDVGFHYVAVDSAGTPIDTDGDGLADYFEDTSGDGSYNTGDLSNWNSADTDGDGVNDFTEYVQGRNPRVPNIITDTNGVINLQVYTPLK